MAVIRQGNFLGQQRVDAPHLRSIESGVAADFDLLAGKIMAGGNPVVIRGFDLDAAASVGVVATALQINVANGAMLHPLATAAGTLFEVASSEAAQVLNEANSNVSGSWTNGVVNYVGIDLVRESDSATADLVKFLASGEEVARTVALAKVLKYRIYISTLDFDASPRLCPVAKVSVSSSGVVESITDCRPLLFGLATGGTAPDSQYAFSWPNGRSVVGFEGGEKQISSEKEWKDAIMTRLWELGGGPSWYSPSSDREMKIAFGSATIPATNTNVDWDLGSETLEWAGLSVIFANSAGHVNNIRDSSIVLEDGYCLYADIDRTQNLLGIEGVDLQKAPLSTLGAPIVPGSRVVVAWRVGDDVYVKDYPFEVGRALNSLPTPSGDPLAVLFEGSGGASYWGRITEDMIQAILAILTFSPTTPLVEKGATVATPAFTATYAHGPATSALLDDSDGSAQKNVSSTPTSFASNATFTKSTTGSNPAVTFTLTAHAGATPDTATTTITWCRYHYAGTDTSSSPTLNSAFVKGLYGTTGGSRALTTSRGRRIQMLSGSAPSNAYVYFAYPTYLGALSSVYDNISGFVVTSAFTLVGTASSVTTEGTGSIGESYYVYRSVVLQNGNVDITVS